MFGNLVHKGLQMIMGKRLRLSIETENICRPFGAVAVAAIRCRLKRWIAKVDGDGSVGLLLLGLDFVRLRLNWGELVQVFRQ
jgi:hypothetical protein